MLCIKFYIPGILNINWLFIPFRRIIITYFYWKLSVLYVLQNNIVFFYHVYIVYLFLLKELRNCILSIIRVWPLLCSVQVCIFYLLLLKLGFNLSVFGFLVFLYLWLLVFSFSVQCFEFNVVSKRLLNHICIIRD